MMSLLRSGRCVRPWGIIAARLLARPVVLQAVEFTCSPEHRAGVNRAGPFPASKPVKVEKVDRHLERGDTTWCDTCFF